MRKMVRMNAFSHFATVSAAAGAAGLLLLSGAASAQTPAPAKPSAQAQAPAKPPARPAAPAPSDPKLDAARAAFAALPESDRKAIQEALVWAGVYTGGVDGSFGKRTYDSLVAFETKAKLKADGILDAKERKALDEEAARARQVVKFATFNDPRNGVRLGIPERYLDKSTPTKTGTRFAGPGDKALLTTLAYEAETKLEDVFDRLKADKPPARRVTYKVLRPDFLVVAGEDVTSKGEARRFYTRIGKPPAGNTAGLRGFTMSYAADLAPTLDPIVIAIANSFEAFPAAAPSPIPAPNTPAAAAKPTPALPLPPSGKVPDSIARIPPPFLGTGLVVAPGKVATTAALDVCPEVVVGKAKGRVVKADKASGVSLIEVAAAAPGAVSPLRVAANTPDGEIVAAGFAPGPGGGELIVAGGALSTRGDKPSVQVPLQGGATGSAVFDRTGALIGLVAAGTSEPRRIAGVVPPATYPLVKAQVLAAALQAGGITVATASDTARRSTGEIAAAAGPLLVPIACTSPQKP